MGTEKAQEHTAQDPAHPSSTGRVGEAHIVRGDADERGGPTVENPEPQEPEFGRTTADKAATEDMSERSTKGSHVEGVRKGEEQGYEQEHESLGTTGAGRPAGRKGEESNRPTTSSGNADDVAGQTP
jgi:hypothetical protein